MPSPKRIKNESEATGIIMSALTVNCLQDCFFSPPDIATALFSRLTRGMKPPVTATSAPKQTPATASAGVNAGESDMSQAQRHADMLVRVGRDQDRAAFVDLFHFFAPRIKSYLLKNGADETTAEEAVQNTFVTVWEKAASYNPKKSAASTWIFTVARNKRIDALRRQKFVMPLEDDALDSLNTLDNTPHPVADAYADQATIEQLHTAIDSLPKEQAQLLHMAFFEDKSHQAISDATALPLGTVKSRLRLAMDKLRHALRSTQ